MANKLIQTEETLIIETPERVPLHFALASIGNRFLACAVDHFIQLIFYLLIYQAVATIASFSIFDNSVFDASKWIIAIAIIIIFCLFAFYFIFFEWVWSGQTPGKRWMKLRVIREDGRPITFFESAVRNFVRLFDMMPMPFYSVGLLSVFISNRDQRVGDLAAGTVVVREREAEAPSFEQVFMSPVSDSAYRRSFKPVAFSADLSPITEEQIEVIESFLRRRWDLPEEQRKWMAWRVAMPILYKLKPAYDMANFTYEGFLEELLHRYRATHRFVD